MLNDSVVDCGGYIKIFRCAQNDSTMSLGLRVDARNDNEVLLFLKTAEII
ncbi:hypothetical protein AGMMS49983_06430 [Clostridia bacterium]|nr:hypothetical protein AGMMS49983_06430 [Clostridia bacterium]